MAYSIDHDRDNESENQRNPHGGHFPIADGIHHNCPASGEYENEGTNHLRH